MIRTLRWTGLWVCLGSGVALAAASLPDAFASDQVLWELPLGTHQYTVPVLHAGRLYAGTNDKAHGLVHPAVSSTGGGVLHCLDPNSGRRIWELAIPRYMAGVKPPFHFNHWRCGVCSQPAFDGDRLYIVEPRGGILCLDQAGQANGNDGPFQAEADYMGATAGYVLTEGDGDVIWRYDLIQELGVVPHDVCGSAPLVYGDCVYACTGNGQDDKHARIANPEAPSLVALDKRTGALVATDGGLFGARLFHGNWSSPRVGVFGGRPTILFGGGDGVLYAFRPVDPRPGAVQALELLWRRDCNPPDYRMRDGHPCPYSRWNHKSPEGPSEIIASPVVHAGRVYVSIGQSPVHGPGQGQLNCVDGLTGDLVWASREVDRTLSDPAIADGLLYICDRTKNLLCLDAETGRVVWRHDMEAGTWCASPVIVDGKVLVSTEKNVLWVLRAGREKRVLARSRLRSMAITPAVFGDVLYFPTQKTLLALRLSDWQL